VATTGMPVLESINIGKKEEPRILGFKLEISTVRNVNYRIAVGSASYLLTSSFSLNLYS
jgi:hypothetical protein